MPGRPRKSSSDLRALSLKVRLTPGEAVQLDLFAKEAGTSTSEFVRARALTGAPALSISADLKSGIYRLLLALRNNAPREIIVAEMKAVLKRLQA